MKVLIIGGGAGGASCAARLRRLDDKAEITILEKTAETSIASCGLPYYIGGVIADRGNMQVASPALFKNLFNIDIRTGCEATEILPREKLVKTSTGENFSYDKLVLATGAKPFVPPVKGMEKLPCFTLKTLADADKIKEFAAARKPQKAVVAGGGFIGVETAENLRHLGIETTLIEAAGQILPPLDADMVCRLHKEMRRNGVALHLNDGLAEINEGGVVLASGAKIAADMAVLALGVRPETALAQQAGIATDARGAILTDEFMQTNLTDIYACGDNAATRHTVYGAYRNIALAGPANRQGRLIADHIAGHAYPYGGTQGTGVAKVFALTAAFTGANERELQSAGMAYEKMIINAAAHAGYYPGADMLTLKVLYDKNGKILGAQAVGAEGADKRIDVIAAVMRLNGTVRDLRDAELCYAPPYSSAKDPVNLVGMAIENAREGLVVPWFDDDFDGMTVLDVRPPEMYAAGHIEGAINIPGGQIRKRLNELPKDKTILVHCVRGYTSYVVARILMQNGFSRVLSYAGGWLQYQSKREK